MSRRRLSGTKRRRHENIQRRANINKIRARDIVSRLRCKASGTPEEIRASMERTITMAHILKDLLFFIEKMGLHGENHKYLNPDGLWRYTRHSDTGVDFKQRIDNRMRRVIGYAENKIKRKTAIQSGG